MIATPSWRSDGHAPTGPMAVDYVNTLPTTGDFRGAAAYHDKHFALEAVFTDTHRCSALAALGRLGTTPGALEWLAGRLPLR
jgi:hypothetical protein